MLEQLAYPECNVEVSCLQQQLSGLYQTYCSTVHVSANSSCPIGHYCPIGSDAPLHCDNGTYQDDETMVACKICPAGYFCDNTISIVILDNSTTICPAGSYCPEGTSFHNEWLCPIGTFNGVTGRQSASDCNPCLGGYYCPVAGVAI